MRDEVDRLNFLNEEKEETIAKIQRNSGAIETEVMDLRTELKRKTYADAMEV